MVLCVYMVTADSERKLQESFNEFAGENVGGDALAEAAFDFAVRNVIFKYFPNGFGLTKKNMPTQGDVLCRMIVACSGNHIYQRPIGNGEFKVEDKSVPDRVFEIEVTKE